MRTVRVSEKGKTPAPEPIAVIGLGCRFPGGADNPEAFWRLLRDGVDGISEVPPDRWNAERFYDPDGKPGTAVTKWGGFVHQPVDRFDALFFGMSPREAAHLDPMQRWLLEVSWEALEDAGLVPAELAGGDVGVFVGVFTEDTKLHQLRGTNRELIGPHTGTGIAMTMASNRVSHFFDFRGPSFSVDTACSSSLVALHLACQSLWDGESSLALVGGANAMFSPEHTIAESRAGMLSPEGRCKTFDARADGYVRGEGAGVVVLKRLADAERDGDRIHAVVLGTGVNQDGKTPGITVPNGEAQERLVREVCARAGVDPRDVGYMEAHGTGTPVGDPIEAWALSNVLGASLDGDPRPEGDKCVVASVKTNFGHLEAAAGVAGLIKAVLCLKHRQIPPHLHLETPNPELRFDEMAIRVPSRLEPWPEGKERAIAAVNSFGFGGTNAHAVLAAAPERAAEKTEKALEKTADAGGRRSWLVPISARGPEALTGLAARYRDLASSPEAPPLPAIAAAAALHRGHHEHRLAVIAADAGELAEALGGFVDDGEHDAVVSSVASGTVPADAGERPLAFCFSGMGPQWWAMGRELLAEEPVFRETLERCDRAFSRHVDWSLLEELAADEESSNMTENWLSQPANFALQAGLVELLRSWGIEPDAVVGHSVGESASMWASGVLDLESAVEVVYHRSRLQQTTAGQGRLVAVGASEAEVAEAIAGRRRVAIAAINSPGGVTLAGDADELAEVVAPFEERGVFVRFLRVEVPYHSHFMDPLEEELLASLADLDPKRANLPFYSTVTGGPAVGPELDAAYWFRNVRQTVRFAPTVERMIADGYHDFLEVGPHPVLGGSIRECLEHAGVAGEVVATLRRKSPERPSLLGAVGRLYTVGHEPGWRGLVGERGYVDLPTYAWHRGSYWEESAASMRERLEGPGHPLLGNRLADPHPTWQVELDGRKPAHLRDHRIQGVVVFPAAAYVEMGIAAAREALGDPERVVELEGLRFTKALFLAAGELAKVRLHLDPEGLGFDLQGAGVDGGWSRHADGRVARTRRPGPRPALELEAVAGRCPRRVDPEAGYARLEAMGFEYGPLFRGLAELAVGEREALARIDVPEPLAGELGSYHLHPALLDACFQALILLATETADAADGDADADAGRRGSYLPVALDRMTVHGTARGPLAAHLRLRRWDESVLAGDVTIADAGGRVVAEIESVRAQSLERGEGAALDVDELLFDVEWRPYELPSATDANGDADVDDPGRWALFVDGDGKDAGVGGKLAARLEAAGAEVYRLRPGDGFELEGRAGALDPASPGDFDRLLDATGPLAGVVHLWSLDDVAAATDELDGAALAATQERGPVTLLHLLQALGRTGWSRPPRCTVVTRGAQRLPGDDAPTAFPGSSLWGFGRTVFHQEQLDLSGRLIDLDPAGEGDGEVEALAHLLLHRHHGAGERDEGEEREDQVTLRAGAAFRPRLVPGPARDDDALISSAAPRFRADGAYLVTGGLGGLGLTLARWLVEHGARRLILMGRSPLPPREEWGDAEPGSTAAERIRGVRELELAGASVHLAAVDVTDPEALAAYLHRYRREGWPPVRGVVHSAGVAEPRLTLETDAGELRWTLAPKLIGGWNLHRALDREPLDFFVLMSSITSFGVSMGMGAYAAANAALDGLAHYRRATGRPATAVNWGAWADVGMASAEEVARNFSNRGLLPMAPELGVRALGRLFELDPPQLIASLTDWRLLADRSYPMGQAPPLISELVARAAAGDGAAADDGDEVAANDPAARRRALAQQVARTLGLEPDQLDAGQPLTRMGLDSMLAVELKNRLQKTLGVDLPLVKLLQGQSVDQLAAEYVAETEVGETVPAGAPIEVPGEAPQEGEFALSHGQMAMWLEYQIDPDSWAYNALSAVRLHTAVDVDALRAAFQELIDRHAVLRTTYRVEDGESVQTVHPELPAPFEHFDLRDEDPGAADSRMVEEARRPFHLEGGPVVRMCLFTRADSDHLLLLVGHHIALDLWSLGLLYRELDALYPAKAAGEAGPVLPAPERNYLDYVAWQRELLAGAEGERLESFWRRRLADPPPPLPLPLDRPRPETPTRRGVSRSFRVPRGPVDRLRRLAAARGTTLFATLVAAYHALFHRLTGVGDVAFCSPMAGRDRGEWAGVVGHFVRTLPLRADLSGDPPFGELVEGAGRELLEVLDHQEIPESRLVRLAQEGREGGRSTLFDVGLAFNTAAADEEGEANAVSRPGARWRVAGLEAETLDLPQQAGQLDLALELFETGSGKKGEGDGLLGTLQYKPELFDETTARRFVGHFLTLLEGAAAAPEGPVSALPLLPPAERQQLLVEWPSAEVRVAGGGVVPGGAHVLDRRLSPLPAGAVGEIWVPKKTPSSGVPEGDPRWRPNPFAGGDAPGGERGWLLRTGELGRFTAGGVLERLGAAPEAPATVTDATVTEPPEEAEEKAATPVPDEPAATAGGGDREEMEADPEGELDDLFGEVLDELEPSSVEGGR